MSANSDPSNALSRDSRLNELIVEYLEAAERGAAPPVEDFIAKHSEYAESLRAFLNDQAQFRELAKQVAPGSTPDARGADKANGAMPVPASGSDPFAATINVRPGESSAPPSKPVLRYFGDYELLHEIARGGMGVVYKARQVSLNRIVAVKMILSGQLASEEDVRRFYTEAEAAAQLDHPGIVSIFEVGKQNDQHFFSMAFVDGPSLARRVADGPLPPREAAELLKSVSEAVHYAHEKGVIHRDLKPGNILLARSDPIHGVVNHRQVESGHYKPKITDFGLAKLTENRDESLTGTGQILGTPAYMPPEQAAAKASVIGVQSDVYSLGAVLYCLLTGRPPFYAATPLETLMQVQQQEPVSLRALNGTVPQDLETIVLKCLDKSPSRRYATAQQLADELGRYLEGRPILARPVGRVERTWRWCRRNPVVAALSGLAVGLLIAVAMVSFVAYRREAKLSSDLTEQSGKLSDSLNKEKTLTSDLTDKGNKLAKSLENEKALTAAETQAKNEMRQARDDERKQRERADENAERADKKEKETRRTLYAAHMNLAQAAWEDARIYRLIQLLAQHGPGTSSEDLRGFEWFYWDRLCQSDTHTFPGTGFAVFSPDSKRIVSASLDQTVRVWDSVTRKQVFELRGFAGFTRCAAYSSDGNWIATGGDDAVVKIWDAVNGKEAKSLNGHKGPITAVAFSPDSTKLVSADFGGTVKLWNVATGRETRTLSRQLGTVRAISFSPDGKRFATSGASKIATVWNAATGQEVLTLSGHSDMVSSVRFSSDGQQVATASNDHTAKLWDAATGKEIATLRGHTSGVSSVAFRKDNAQLASASSDQTVKIWDLTTGQPIESFKGHQAAVLTVEFSDNGKQILTADGYRTVRLWETETNRESRKAVGPIGHQGMDIKFSDSGTRITVAGVHTAAKGDAETGRTIPFDPVIKLWDSSNGQVVMSLPGDKTHFVSALAFSPDGARLASAYTDHTDHSIKVWNLKNGETSVSFAKPSAAVQAVAFTPDGKMIGSAGEDGALKLWNAATGAELLTIAAHATRVTAMRFSADGTRIATSSDDRTVKLWNRATGELISTFRANGGICFHLTFSEDGRQLVSSHNDGIIKLWDTQNGNELVTLQGHSNAVFGCVFSPDGTRLASVSSDGLLKLWDVASGQETLSLKCRLGAVKFSPDGSQLVSAGDNGVVQVWTTEPTAQRIVNEQFAQGLFQTEVIAAINADKRLTLALREQALELARQREGDVDGLILASRNSLWWPNHPRPPYERALLQAELATRLAPDNGDALATLGVAQFRNGQFEAAIQTLKRSSAMTVRQGRWGVVLNELAILAMAQWKLGQVELARETLKQARATTPKSTFQIYPVFIGFLREAEAMIEPGKDAGK